MEAKAKQIIGERFDKILQYEFDGFGSCESSIKYHENGEVKILATFEKMECECLTGEEFARLLNENSSNKAEKFEIGDESAKNKEKTQNNSQKEMSPPRYWRKYATARGLH